MMRDSWLVLLTQLQTDCSSEISAADTDLLCAAVCSDAPDSLDWGGCGAWPYQTEKGFSVGKENKSLCHCGLCKK